MDLFTEKGFDNTTVSEIADAADIGKGTFFTYFPTKEAIFSEVVMETMATTLKNGLAASLSVSNILRDAIAAPAAWHEANKHITQQVIRSHFSMHKDTSNKERLVTTLSGLIRIGHIACESTLYTIEEGFLQARRGIDEATPANIRQMVTL